MSQAAGRRGVSVEDPKYAYAPAKNPYAAKIRALHAPVLSDGDTELHAGRWRTQFADAATAPAHRPLHVEIGCNAGHVILEWAAREPQKAFIGIDWKFKAIFRAAEKAAKRGLKNILFLRAHAERLPFIFGEAEVSRLSLYFPDPWAKKSQLKNRYFTAGRLERLAPLLPPDGLFDVKTDHPGYFDWMLEHAGRAERFWRLETTTRDLHAGVADPRSLKIPEITLFEGLFIKDGIKIQALRLRRNHD